MTDDTNIGLGSYNGGQVSRPRQVLEMMLRKAQLRSLLEIEQAKITEAVPMLNAAEVEQLKAMLASEVEDCGRDAEALRQQIEREVALVTSLKAMDVKLSRAASRTLQAEMLRRVERGHCPAPAALVGEAVERAFAGSRP